MDSLKYTFCGAILMSDPGSNSLSCDDGGRLQEQADIAERGRTTEKDKSWGGKILSVHDYIEEVCFLIGPVH